jgi:hypothetical protein
MTGNTSQDAETEANQTAKTPPVDLELARLLAVWPTLPEAIRRGILAMIEASTGR